MRGGHRWKLLTNSGPVPRRPHTHTLVLLEPSAGVHVLLIYCVRKQCCIICVLRNDINPSPRCGKRLFFPSPRLNVHCLKNDTSSKYFWAKAELYNFPISSERLSVERRNYMSLNGFLNSDITSLRTKEGGSATIRGVRTPARLAISAASIKVTHCAAAPGECMSDNTAKTNGALSRKPR